MEIQNLSLYEISKNIVEKKLSSEDLCKAYLARIQKLNPLLNAYITVNEKLLEEARSSDLRIQQGKSRGPLEGIPIGIKDMICTRGMQTTAASKILKNFIPPYDATLVEKLKQSGALVLGKLNQDEFAMGSSNETSYFGICRNPWSREHVPGGSSGGSAAAQAAALCSAAIGTDTGGSIRQPASFCGVVGVKPTYGRISRYGVIAYASSLDQAGPLTKTVSDSALLLDIMCGHDDKDATSSAQPPTSFFKNLNSDVRGLKIGLIQEFMSEGLGEETRKAVEESVEILKSRGASVQTYSLPLMKEAIPVYYLIASSEASSNLSRYDGVKYGYRAAREKNYQSLEEMYEKTRGQGFGEEVKRRIMLGTFCLSSGYFDAYYKKASQVRRLIQTQMLGALSSCDVLIGPVSTHPAFKIGEKLADPLSMYLNDLFTVATNLAGLPGMSLPAALSRDKLPIGVQIMAKPFDEQKMLNVALSLEEARPELQKIRPEVFE